uniref:Uncharacterized protein n=1 Tax=Zea mays TaxID=4577 RepID=B4FQD2_MAIZE|nr:unknown [Zea mays]
MQARRLRRARGREPGHLPPDHLRGPKAVGPADGVRPGQVRVRRRDGGHDGVGGDPDDPVRRGAEDLPWACHGDDAHRPDGGADGAGVRVARAPVAAAAGLQGQGGVHGGDGSAAAGRSEAAKPRVLIGRADGRAHAWLQCARVR